MLELYLSCLASWDAQVQAKGCATQASFHSLFPDFSCEQPQHPNALFFAWLADHSGSKKKLAHHIHQINKQARDADIDSARRQLRRWKSGKGFASDDMLDALFRNLYSDRAIERENAKHKDWRLSWSMVSATKRIIFLMPILLPLRSVREPLFPFGHQSVQEWRENRYPYWYDYWLPRWEKRP